jgi:hypothetical protein
MDLKSLGEFVSGLYAAMFDDIAVEYPTLQRELIRDYKRISSAIDTHGVQFALITMPDYRKHFDKCLDSGLLTHTSMTHFGRYKHGSPIPRLFKGLMLRVFDQVGVLRSSPDVRAIFWIRQLLGVVRRLKLACSDSSVWKQTDEFFKVDAAVRLPTTSWEDPAADFDDYRALALRDFVPSQSSQFDLFGDELAGQASVTYELAETIQLVADILISDIGRFDPSCWRARHGPGAVSDQKGGYKYDFPNWPEKLATIFPYEDYGVHAHSALGDHGGTSRDLQTFESEAPARLLVVPKTLKAPRLIASEPVSHQWCQQIMRDYLMSRTSQTLAGAFVNFRRQDLSQRMVRAASRNGNLATVDLSSASDRISCFLVERIFRSTPSTINAFKAVRTRWVYQDIDKHLPKYLRIRKFSTMGSALTFPVQSLVFLAIALGCALHARGETASRRTIGKLRGQVRVFGDDIIVPANSLGLLGNTLEAFGLKVNVDKTFGTGRFRESCGEDAFAGTSVVTVNVNEFPRKSAPGSVASSVDVHNNLFSHGLLRTAAYVRRTVASVGKYFLPEVQPDSGDFGWNTYDIPNNSHLKRRWNKDLHRYEARIHRASARVDRVLAEGNPGLLQYFTEAVPRPTSATSTLGYLPRRPKVKLSLGWAAL